MQRYEHVAAQDVARIAEHLFTVCVAGQSGELVERAMSSGGDLRNVGMIALPSAQAEP